jgi:hypothetical protein
MAGGDRDRRGELRPPAPGDPVQLDAGQRAPLRLQPRRESFKLPDGLTVALSPEPRANLVSVDVRYLVGAVDDPAGKSGSRPARCARRCSAAIIHSPASNPRRRPHRPATSSSGSAKRTIARTGRR